MWRSIQTLYLGIATALMAALFFCRFATIIGPDGAEETIRYYEKTPYLVLMIMTLTAHICSVFSYKLRFLQARVCIITALLALGMQVWFFMDFMKFRHDMVFSITMIFPLVMTILDVMAARNSLVDEMTVSAVRSVRKIRRRR
ncbi:MAG: DUF4293 family protein [Bacteroidales bacterium]|nr:DUF4293 family protein [Bacteroidales bacterium]